MSLILTLTLNLVLPSIVFHNIFCYRGFDDFIIFTAYSRLMCLYEEELSVRPYDKYQLRCSLIVTPRYLTCVVHEIYWSLILKFRCFIIFFLHLSPNIKTSEYQNSRIIIGNIGISHRLPV